MARTKKEDVVLQEEVQNENVKAENVKAQEVEEIDKGEIKLGEVVKPSAKDYCDYDKLVICLNFPTPLLFKIKRPGVVEHEVVFMGNGSELIGKGQGILPVGAYGMTPNVDRADWEWIKENYKDLGLIKEGLLFASSAKEARDAAAERRDLRNGYEPRDPNNIDGHNSLNVTQYA